MFTHFTVRLILASLFGVALGVPESNAESPAAIAEPAVTGTQKAQLTELAEGRLLLPVPEGWKAVKPRNRIIELEFAVSAPGEATSPARFTVMPSGGSIAQNLARWRAQFRRLDQPSDPSHAKPEKLSIQGMNAFLVNLSGDYLDSPRGPFGPKVEQKEYQVLAAIVQTKDSGNYFFKLVGPQQVVRKQVPAFRRMVLGIQPVDDATSTSAAAKSNE